MRILQHLTIENLRKNRRRTIVTILGVALSSALILAVVGMVTSLQKMMIQYATEQVGDYHDMYESVPPEAMKYIENNVRITQKFYSEPVTKDNFVDEETYDWYQTYQNEAYTAKQWTRLDQIPADSKDEYNVFVRYDHPRDYKKVRDQILDTIERETGASLHVRTNSELLKYEGVGSDVTLATIYSLATIVIGIIIVTSVVVIRNSFSISASERERQFGMLSSIGATPRQIRSSVIYEGVIIGTIGIPLGMLLGSVAVFILVFIMNYLMQDMIEVAVPVSMPLWIFPAAILLSFVTIFLSSLMPAIRAAKLSPIEAIRGSKSTRIKAKKLHTSNFVRNAFGIGGVIADKNLKRSRKKYRTTVISIVLSVATFIGLYSFMEYGQRSLGIEYDNSNLDLAVSNASKDFYQDLQERFHLQNSAYYIDTHSVDFNVVIMQQSAFEDFAKSLDIRQPNYDQVVIMNNQSMQPRGQGGYEFVRDPNYHDGPDLKLSIQPDIPEKCIKSANTDDAESGSSIDDACVKQSHAEAYDLDLKLTKVTDHFPVGLSGTFNPMIFVGENYPDAARLLPRAKYSQFFAENVDDVKAITDYIDQYISEHPELEGEIHYANVKESAAQMRRIYLLFAIFLYGFIIVVTLIGVTNIFNTITTNIALRAKEFAMLKSIGMTSREFNHMVRLESLMYSIKALLIGIPLGLLLSYGVYLSVANSIDFGFLFPWIAILIAITAVGLLVSIIMHYSVRQVEKQNIIETIRSENV